MITLTDGTTVEEAQASTDLEAVASEIDKALAQERTGYLAVSRKLASVKASGLAIVILTDDEREKLTDGTYRSAFNTWTEERFGIDKVKRSRYLNHADTVDSLVAAGVNDAESISADLARTLVKIAKSDSNKAKTPAAVVKMAHKANVSPTVKAMKAKYLPPKAKVYAPAVRKISNLVDEIIVTYDSDTPVDFGDFDLAKLYEAHADLAVWIEQAEEMLATQAAESASN